MFTGGERQGWLPLGLAAKNLLVNLEQETQEKHGSLWGLGF